MSALCTGDDTVRAYNDVTVEVCIDLKCSEDDEIQLVDVCALVERVCILICRDVEVTRIGRCGADRILVEILRIYEAADEAFLEEVTHWLCDTADTEGHVDITLTHDLCEVLGGSDGSTADTGLVGEALLEVRCVHNEVCAVLRHEQLSLIRRRLRCAGGDLRRITDLVDLYDIIDLHLRNLCRKVWEWYQCIGDRNYAICILCIHCGVGKYAAVCLTAVGVQVTILIRGWCADEGDVDVGLAAHDGSRTGTVGTHDRKSLKTTV